MQSICIRGLSFAYDDSRMILKDVDLDIKSGEFVCLLGQSGCGKSTLLRLLAGLETPTAGEITIDGEPIKEAGLDRGVVFQDYGLFPWKTAGENIRLALRKKFPDKDKEQLKKTAVEMLIKVGLDADVYKKLPKELSGGMKQRCAIARAFGIDPPILLMDEPFGALDAVTRARLQDMVLDLWKKDENKKTVIFVTHDVEEALLLSSRVLVLGQSPSHVIFSCEIPRSGGSSRESLYESREISALRSELIRHINSDISGRI